MISYDILEFQGKIIGKFESKGKFYVELEKTNFYPDGKGGQLGDRGFIGNARVLSVKEDNSKILHEVETLDIEENPTCIVDKERRLEIAREHTAQHILSQSFQKLYNIETLSFHMGENYSTIDLNIEKLGDEKIEEAELLANRIVLENREVKKYYINEDELEKLNLRKKLEIKGPIRIVEVEGFDVSMCSGTHVGKTGEIGIIKIIKVEKTKKDLTRIYFTSGLRTLRNFQEKTKIIDEISRILTTGESELKTKINKLITENKKLLDLNKYLEEKFINEVIVKLYSQSEIKEVFENISRKSFEVIVHKTQSAGKSGFLALIDKESLLVAIINANIHLPYKSFDINGITFYTIEIVKKDEALKRLLELKGGN
ncbi:alanyl-tRNA editing protein [Caldisericum exile]|uniref:alanyl-tRNA editing protein n=1 Tax=Caldisericum exile TaxID=693075 RepID=UPI003C72D0F7